MSNVDAAVNRMATLFGDAIQNASIQFTSAKLGGRAQATYDFAVDGGAVGSIALTLKIPANTIVLDGMIYVEDAVTSGGSATVAVQLEGAGDILAAAAIAGLTANTLIDIVPDGTAANAFITTVERTLTVVVATAALTAGRFHIVLNTAQIAPGA